MEFARLVFLCGFFPPQINVSLLVLFFDGQEVLCINSASGFLLGMGAYNQLRLFACCSVEITASQCKSSTGELVMR